MTEEQAKTKWCHKCLPQKTSDATANWGWDGKCLGSACMAWRWVRPDHWVDRDFAEGNCGLAGKP